MKKRTIIPAIIVMGFFAGCEWCSCSKQEKATTVKPKATFEHEQTADAHAVSKTPAHHNQNASTLHHPDVMPEEDHDMDMIPEGLQHPAVAHQNESPMLAALAKAKK